MRRVALTLGLLGLLAGCPGEEPEAPSDAAPASPESAEDSESATQAPDPATPDVTPAPPAVPGGPRRGEAIDLLTTVVKREAGKPANAWALAHGILAMGPGFTAGDGRPALQVLVDDFLKAERLPGLKGLQPYFPDTTEAGLPVEPHTDLILKTLIEVGLSLDEPLLDREGAPTLERLLRSARARYTPKPDAKGTAAFAKPDDVAWSLQAFCQAVDVGAAETWPGVGNAQANIDVLARQQLEMLEAETWFMRQAMVKGESVQKRRQGIFAFTCGGAHLHQAVVACAASGFPRDDKLAERIDKLNEIYQWRIPLETKLVEDAMQQAPKLAPLLYNQDVKFLGHLLESLGKAEWEGFFSPTGEERLLLEDAEGRLLAHVIMMNKLGVYDADKLAGWMASADTRQFYLDVVGDASHALSGIKIQAALRAKRAEK